MAVRTIIVLVLLILTSDIFASDKNYVCLQRLETGESHGTSITVGTLYNRTFMGVRPAYRSKKTPIPSLVSFLL